MKLACLVAAAAAISGCAADRMSVSASEPHGIIVVGNSQMAKDVYPVILQEIDGRQVPDSAASVPVNASAVLVDRNFTLPAQTAYYLSPGPHVLRLTAIIRADLALTLPPTQQFADRDAGLIKLNVAEGRRYLLGAKLDDARPEHWLPFVYAVEDIPAYESGFEDR